MRDMLIRAIEAKSDDFEVDREILVDADLLNAKEEGISLDADWIITMETSNIIPLPVIDAADSNPKNQAADPFQGWQPGHSALV